MGTFTPRRETVYPTMYKKTQGLIGNSGDLAELYVTDAKGFIEPERVRRRKEGELKNEG